MGKLFQNGVQSEIVAGHFGEDSLEGLYLGGDYFQIKKKVEELFNVYFGRLYSVDGNNDIEPAYINTISDADFAKMVLGQETDAAYTVESEAIETDDAYNLELAYKQYDDSNIDIFSKDFYAIPTSAVKAGTLKIFDIGADNYYNTTGYSRTVMIGDVEYTVFYGWCDAGNPHRTRFEIA